MTGYDPDAILAVLDGRPRPRYPQPRRAEDAWLARQDEERRNRPRLPDPWGHDNKEENR